ncbi:uncharacterized protein LOC131070439 isoform X1 [Cryptomeria japonica]|uniref:uncharacterized protein LOC131070439 isoform X1 n=1 Tax=Cryptomeria japonica TaxID=3369 RepID=UPI0027D9D213|nr:uncharacterized protein LOC131070439 isoform X1 [Cryptomeria japonica]
MRPELFIAAKKGNLETLKNLHRENPIGRGEVTFEGNTALHIAAREGHLEVVQWILNNAKGCCIAGARNFNKNTPLQEAAKKGNAEVLSILLQNKKSGVYRRNQYGETALIIASEYGHVGAVRLLLAATPLFLVFWPRDDRQTCLNVAAYAGHLEVVKLILNAKSNCFNAIQNILLIKDENGVTPLHAAVHGGHVNIVREILNIPFKCGCYCSPRSLMTKVDNLGRCAIHIAAMKGFINIIDELIKIMPDCVEIRSTCLETVVHFAVEYNQFDVVKRLTCENEGERNAKLLSYDYDIHGNTALHLAVKNGVNPELVEYIVSTSNANLNAKNNEGQSPLDIAVAEASQNKVDYGEIVRVLEDVGATRSFIFECKSKSKLPAWDYSLKITNQSNNDAEGKVFDVDTLVASLIATITFTAIFQVPGGTHDGLASMSLETIYSQIVLLSSHL